MNSKIVFRPPGLQQQPQRAVNQQQQQSSGAGEFQRRFGRQADEAHAGLLREKTNPGADIQRG